MTEGPRRLSAVMLTDLVGYTALTQKDEALALRVLESHRAVLRPLFDRHHGREIKTIGDAFLVEFESALEATQCAIEIQRALRQGDRSSPESHVDLRIGVHVGDVVHRDGDVYGDAVNIVSRIEPLAEPGGICLSQTVFDQVRNKIDFPLKKLGAPQLKNVLFPVEVYQVELPWSREPGFGTPWVGRGAEMAVLERAIDRATKRERTVVFVSGEAGVGKSRLVEEAVEVARRKGLQVLRGRCVRAELAAPYAPWSEAIRAFVRTAPGQQVYKVCGGYGNEIVKLVPELAERLGQLPPPVAGDPDQARLRFYEGITQFFANVAQEAPLLLFFDDLQWGDAPTLRLFAYAAGGLRDRPVVMVGAFEAPEENDEGPLQELVRDLRRDRLSESVTLPRFTPEQVAEVAGAMFGESEISDEFRQLLFDRTGGNPFYLTETLRALVDAGMVYRTPEGRWERKEIEEIQIPKTVRDAIRERFNRLDKGVQETLRTASVLGSTFSAELLGALVNLKEDELIDHLERAVEARIVREEPSSSRSLDFSFTDSHVRDLLYGEMLTIRRARYHRQAAEALERLSKGRTESVAADLAHHFREGHEAEKALRFSVIAGDSAKNVFAFEEAERQYGVALELLREFPDAAVEANVLASLGEVHHAQGRLPLAIGEWDSAIRLFAQAGLPLRAGTTSELLVDVLRVNPDVSSATSLSVDEVLERGRVILEGAPPSVQLARFYDLCGVWLVDQSRFPEAREWIERAVRLAHELGNERTEMSVMDELAMVAPIEGKEQAIQGLHTKFEYFTRPDSFDPTEASWAASNLATAYLNVRSDAAAAARWAAKAVEAVQRTHNVSEEMRLRASNLTTPLFWAGDLVGVERQLKLASEAHARGGGSARLGLERARARLALLAGDLASARQHVEASLELVPGAGPSAKRVRGLILEQKAEIESAEGRFDSAVRDLREAIEDVGMDAESCLRAGPRVARLAALAGALLGLPEGDEHLGEVEHLASEVHDLAGRIDNPFVLGVDLRLRARLAQRALKGNDARRWLEEAVPLFEKAGNPYELAHTLRQYAQLLRELGETDRSAESFQRAHDVFAKFGATAEARQVESTLGELRSAPGSTTPVRSG